MSRGKPNPKPVSKPASAPVKLESGAGNMSPEDFAAIRGTVPGVDLQGTTLTGGGPIIDPETAPETVDMTATEALLREQERAARAAKLAALDADLNAPAAGPADMDLAVRVATLEHSVEKLSIALERWAAVMNTRPAVTAFATQPAIIRPASKEEEAAYCRFNFEASSTGDAPFDGIQAWRNGGSPGLKPNAA